MAIPVINPSGITLPHAEAVNIAASATIEIQPSNAAKVTSLEFLRQLNASQWHVRFNLDVQPGFIQQEVEYELPTFNYLYAAGYGAQPWDQNSVGTYTYDRHGYNYEYQTIYRNHSPIVETGHVATSFFKKFWRRGFSTTITDYGPYNAWQGGYTPDKGYPGVSQSDVFYAFTICSRLRIKYGYLAPGPVLTDAATGRIVTNGSLVVVQG